MKFIQIINAMPSLQKLSGQELSMKNLYKVSKLMDSLEKEIDFYNTQRSKILTQYCDIKGNQCIPKEGQVDALNAALGELMDMDIECEIKEAVIGPDENLRFSYNDLRALKGFVRIEGED